MPANPTLITPTPPAGARNPSSPALNRGISKANLGSKLNLHSKLMGTAANLSKTDEQSAAAVLVEERTLENTYRMVPDRKFQAGTMKRILDEYLSKKLADCSYSADQTPEISKQICNEVRVLLKDQKYSRYKYVVQCDICENKGQSIIASSRCVWDTATDACLSSSIKNSTLVAICTVFAMFYE
eukprot:Partr_v1_DN22672_c0_g2_i3_m5298 putative Tctex1 domain containing